MKIIRIIEFFDRHPWDWIAHVLLGFFIYVLNFGTLRAIDLSIYLMDIEPMTRFAGLGAINFVLAIELTQWDIFGISRKMIIDSIVDFTADIVGIGLAIFIFLR